ncbi:phosphoribosylpyrophosphate synthetase [Robiginitalea sp.]|uniref:phosphoribosylpyrophosphate synthetase n=1 Tax=Robiginitalea sp. TaxID=1902411 RepID=UPI003C757837
MKKRHTYSSLSVAIEDLQSRGYNEDLNFCDDGLEHKRTSCIYPAEALEVVEFYRFEGNDSSPDDSSILYAIETSDGLKGLLVDAYGAYSGNIPRDIVIKLRIDR